MDGTEIEPEEAELDRAKQVYFDYVSETTGDISKGIHSTDLRIQKLRAEIEEFSKLKLSCERILPGVGPVTAAKTVVAKDIFVNVEVRDTKHVIVKLAEDMLIELPLAKAAEVCDRRIEALQALITSLHPVNDKRKSGQTMLLNTLNYIKFGTPLPTDEKESDLEEVVVDK